VIALTYSSQSEWVKNVLAGSDLVPAIWAAIADELFVSAPLPGKWAK